MHDNGNEKLKISTNTGMSEIQTSIGTSESYPV